MDGDGQRCHYVHVHFSRHGLLLRREREFSKGMGRLFLLVDKILGSKHSPVVRARMHPNMQRSISKCLMLRCLDFGKGRVHVISPYSWGG